MYKLNEWNVYDEWDKIEYFVYLIKYFIEFNCRQKLHKFDVRSMYGVIIYQKNRYRVCELSKKEKDFSEIL